MFDNLNSVLLSYQLKPMFSTLVERESDLSQPCFVFCSEPEKRIALLLCANKILPENAFVVSEPDWLKIIHHEGEAILYLLEGITMNEWGQCFYVKFKTPQKVTFLCNFLTKEKFSFSLPALKQKAHQFESYETQTNCPMSSSIELNEYIDDKLHTRLLAAAKKLNVPYTLAFSFCLEKYQHHPVSDQVQLINLARRPSVLEMRQYLQDFPFAKFVIKPSGARWMGGRVCTIESQDNLERAVENLQKCLDLLSEKECLLVEEFIDPSLRADSSLGARLRIFVTRRPNNLVATSGILCNLGDVAQPINGDTSETFSLDYLCNYIGLSNQQRNPFIEQLQKLGETVLAAIIDYEDQYLNHLPAHQQTDFIGLDVFLNNNQGQLEPFLIEVNNYDCTSSLQLYEIQHSPHRTNILDKWVETMLYRSYQYMLKEYNLLILGGTSEDKLKGCEWATKLGIKIILPENEPSFSSFTFLSQFLGIELEEDVGEMEKSLAIVQGIRQNQLNVQGVVSLDQQYLALASLVAIFLQKATNSYESVTLAKSQLLTSRKILLDEFDKLTFEARQFSHGVKVFALSCLNDIDNIPLHDYPVLIESESKNSNFIPQIISSQEQLIACWEDSYQKTQPVLVTEISLNSNNRLIATPYSNGLLQDMLLVLSEGKLRAGYLIPFFTTNQIPASQEILAILDQERQENLIYAGCKACRNLNLTEGIFSVKGIFTDLGAKILSIQVSPWKRDLVEWMFNVWDIDLILYSSLIACGFKPYIHQNGR